MGGSIRMVVGCLAFALAFSLPAGASPDKPATPGGPQTVENILDDAVMALSHQVDEHWHEGEYNHIINIYRVVAAARPNMMDAYTNSGWLLWSMDRDDEAVALYEQGLKANPESYHMY